MRFVVYKEITRGGTGSGALHFYERGQESHLYDNSTGIVMNFCAIMHYNYHSWAITSHLLVSGPSLYILQLQCGWAVFQTKAIKMD